MVSGLGLLGITTGRPAGLGQGLGQGREMQVKESGVRVWDEGPEPTWMVMGRRMSQSQSPQGRLWAPVRVSVA